MADYASLAAFYDAVQGDRASDIARVRGCVERFLPSARSLLELGCGTGAVLADLAADMRVVGIDASSEMLAVAVEKVGRVQLVEADMTAFSFDDQFDVVMCIYSSINHLLSFESWVKLFDRVHEHLSAGGLFVFDVNTIGRLHRLGQAPPWVQDFGENTLVMNVTPAGGEISIWDVRIFERLRGEEYRLHHESIAELGVPLARIRTALIANFELLEETSSDGSPVTDESDRVFFTYRHR